MNAWRQTLNGIDMSEPNMLTERDWGVFGDQDNQVANAERIVMQAAA
jgi:hypothetical protein